MTDLAPAAGLPLPTAYRVVMTLTAEGYLKHLSNGDYRPGARVLTLGTAALFTANHGPNGKLSLAELEPELVRIRDDGWAIQDEELAFGLRSAAAPVYNSEGQAVAGANVAVQSRDWSNQRVVRELRPQIVQTCHEISALLGYRGSSQ